MKAVELRTGLSAHLIRVWERRYAAVSPARSATRRRLYTEAEIERLDLLRRLSQSGLAISQIAGLSTESLRTLSPGAGAVRGDGALPSNPASLAGHGFPGPEDLIAEALVAVKQYDIAGLEHLLDQGMLSLGYAGLLEKVLIPLLHGIGAQWEAGNLTASQEHGATAAMKDYLARNLRAMQSSASAPRLMVTTPAGQIHEMGAAIAAGLARKAGWNVIYLGPSLPAEEIASAAIFNRASAVALSIIYPADDPELPHQLRRLRHLLPREIPLIAGGQALEGYRATLEDIGAIILTNMTDFSRTLERVRSGPGKE